MKDPSHIPTLEECSAVVIEIMFGNGGHISSGMEDNSRRVHEELFDHFLFHERFKNFAPFNNYLTIILLVPVIRGIDSAKNRDWFLKLVNTLPMAETVHVEEKSLNPIKIQKINCVDMGVYKKYFSQLLGIYNKERVQKEDSSSELNPLMMYNTEVS